MTGIGVVIYAGMKYLLPPAIPFFIGVVSCIHGTFAGKMVGEKIAYQKRNCRWDFDWSYSVCVSLGDLEIIRHGDFPGGKSYDKYWSMGKTCGQIFKFMLSYD